MTSTSTKQFQTNSLTNENDKCVVNAIRWKRVETIKVNEFAERDREQRGGDEMPWMHIWNFIAILLSFHLPFNCMVWKCFTAISLLQLHRGQSFIPFVLSIFNSIADKYCFLSYVLAPCSKMPTKKGNYLKWWVLHKSIATAFSIHSYVPSSLTFFKICSRYSDLCMHQMCMWLSGRVKKLSVCEHSSIWILEIRPGRW